jgi:hypothetical protein
VVTAIREAFMADDVFASEVSGHAVDLGVLYRRVNSGWSAFQSSRYSLLADQFPVTLRQAQLAARGCEGRERETAAGLLSMLYQLATVALLKLGDVETAWLAADRGVAAAERSEHPLVLGSAGRMLAGREARPRDVPRAPSADEIRARSHNCSRRTPEQLAAASQS